MSAVRSGAPEMEILHRKDENNKNDLDFIVISE